MAQHDENRPIDEAVELQKTNWLRWVGRCGDGIDELGDARRA